jgi:flagellar basal body rod protein FlgF
MKRIFVPMHPSNIDQLLAGTKTTTIRSSKAYSSIALMEGQAGITSYRDVKFKVTNRGFLTIEEAGGKEAMLKSEGLQSDDDFIYKQSKDWVNGEGRLWVYDFKML